jgi:D-arginine dehydrogenase
LDFVVIGAGIGGAGVAWSWPSTPACCCWSANPSPATTPPGARRRSTLETYGTPRIRALTRASRAFLDAPPPGFADSPILSPRGVLYIAGPDQIELLEATGRSCTRIRPACGAQAR